MDIIKFCLIKLVLLLNVIFTLAFFQSFKTLPNPTTIESQSDPFNSINIACIKNTNVGTGLLQAQFYTYLNNKTKDGKHIQRDLNQLDQILLLASKIRTDSLELVPLFEENFNSTSWRNFTQRQQWRFDAFSCEFNQMLSVEMSLVLLGIRDHVLPDVNPSFGFIKTLAPNNRMNENLQNLFTSDQSTGELIDQYYNQKKLNSKKSPNLITKDQILASLDAVEKNIIVFKQDFLKTINEVYQKILVLNQTLAPEDEASIRVLLKYCNWLPTYVEEFRKKFASEG